jgi:hypothetical protein
LLDRARIFGSGLLTLLLCVLDELCAERTSSVSVEPVVTNTSVLRRWTGVVGQLELLLPPRSPTLVLRVGQGERVHLRRALFATRQSVRAARDSQKSRTTSAVGASGTRRGNVRGRKDLLVLHLRGTCHLRGHNVRLLLLCQRGTGAKEDGEAGRCRSGVLVLLRRRKGPGRYLRCLWGRRGLTLCLSFLRRHL